MRPAQDFALSKMRKKYNQNNYHSFCHYLLHPQRGGDIPQYKFFGPLLLKMIKLQQRFGISIDIAKVELRKAALRDFKMSKKVSNELAGLIVQYSFIALFSWFFLVEAKTALKISLTYVQYFLMAGWQLSGLAVGCALYIVLRVKTFGDFERYLSAMYTFRALLMVSRPVVEVVSASGILGLPANKKLIALKERSLLMVKNIKMYGKVSEVELEVITEEIWNTYENEFDLFLKKFIGIKFLLIIFFVFPSFLYVIFLAMQSINKFA